jgi:hypothetical protein
MRIVQIPLDEYDKLLKDANLNNERVSKEITELKTNFEKGRFFFIESRIDAEPYVNCSYLNESGIIKKLLNHIEWFRNKINTRDSSITKKVISLNDQIYFLKKEKIALNNKLSNVRALLIGSVSVNVIIVSILIGVIIKYVI